MSIQSTILALATSFLCCLSCTQINDGYQLSAPKLGRLSIIIQDFQVSLSCPVTDVQNDIEAGFIFGKKFDSTYMDTLIANVVDGKISADIDSLEPETSYCVQAFVSSGQNVLFSPEEVFTTRSINIAKDVKSITLPATDPGENSVMLHARNELGYWATPSDSVECGFLVSVDSEIPTPEKCTYDFRLRIPCSQREFSFRAHTLRLNAPVYFRSYLIANGYYILGEPLESHTLGASFEFRDISIKHLNPYSVNLRGWLEYSFHDWLDECVWVYFFVGEDYDEAVICPYQDRFQTHGHAFSYIIENIKPDTDLYINMHANFIDTDFEPIKPISFRNNSNANSGESIDLGLSVLWRSCNIGAAAPEELGEYYKWGATDTQDNWWYLHHSWPGEIKYSISLAQDYGTPDTIEPVDDIANIILGDGWRIPTSAEFKELINNCDIQFKTINGVEGLCFISKVAGFEGKSIFFPKNGGYYVERTSDYYSRFPKDFPNLLAYWSSTMTMDDFAYSLQISLENDGTFSFQQADKNVTSLFGIRPVKEKP